jgi:hypothetical protein
LWFKADWNSVDQDGIGLQGEGRLLEMGTRGTTNGWWALCVGNGGTCLSFATQTNSPATLTTNLSVPISWSSNVWHQIVLTYDATNSMLYLDGQAVSTNGLGVTRYPAQAVRVLGFTVGSSASGTNQVRGVIDELETFNYPMDAASIYANYEWATTLDSDGNGLSNILENEYGWNPYQYTSQNGLSTGVPMQVFTPLK